MPRRNRSATNWLGPILVALIVAAVAWTVTDRLPTVSNPLAGAGTQAGPGSSTSTPSTASSTPLMVELGIPSLKADRDTRLRIDLASGSSTSLSVPKGWRAGDLTGVSDLQLQPYNDGYKLSGGDWDIVLRSESGELYADPQVVGLFDDSHAAVIGSLSGSRVLVSVNRAGGISKVADISDNANVLGLQDGSVWLSTFIPGEGIESEPHGPSKLIRIDSDGRQEVEATSESVINVVVAGQGAVAYATEGGTYSVAGSNEWDAQGKPLVWLPGKRLLVVRGTSLFLIGPNASDETRISGTVTSEPASSIVVE
ncbi:MAG TPA: hypothetical protein VMU11_01970 [Verrucomicrobiae bacterium]|nr:hypothetical protein [Verrucomicrobiae bacterium]